MTSTNLIILFMFLLITLCIRHHMESSHGFERIRLMKMFENLTLWAKSNNQGHDSQISDEKRKQIQESSGRRLGFLFGGAILGSLINAALLVLELLPISSSFPMIITIVYPLIFSISSVSIIAIIKSLAADAPMHKHSDAITQEEIAESELQFNAIKPTIECVGGFLCVIHSIIVFVLLCFKIDYTMSSLINPKVILLAASILWAIYSFLDFAYSRQKHRTVKNIMWLRTLLALSIYLWFLFFQFFIQ